MAKLNKKNKDDSYMKEPKIKGLTYTQRLDIKRKKAQSRADRETQLRADRLARIQAKRREEMINVPDEEGGSTMVRGPVHSRRAYSQKRFRPIIGGGRMRRLREKIQENRRFKDEITGGQQQRKTQYKRKRRAG